MRIRVAYKSGTNSNVGNLVATGLGRQKSTRVDQSKSLDANMGIAAANLIIHTQRVSPELQYGDNICSGAVRSLDAGYGSHTSNDDGTVHIFTV